MNKYSLMGIYMIVLIAVWFCAEDTFAEDVSDIQVSEESELLPDKMLDSLNLEEIEQYWQKINAEYGNYIPEIGRKNMRQLIESEQKITFISTINGLLHFLLYEIIENGKLLGSLIVLTLFSALLQSIQSAFENSTVSKIAYFVVYLVLLSIVVHSFRIVFQYVQETIELMSNFMFALLPLLLGLLATLGQVFTVGFFQPIIIFFIQISGVFVTSFVLPMLYLSVVLIIVSNLNTKFKATQLADLLKSVSLGALSVFLTIFLGMASIQGTVTAVQDGVALKTTKFITGNFIPVVGRTFTDAAETVLSAALILKNSIGLIGVTVIIFIAVFPMLKIMVISFIYKLAAALLQPLGATPMINSLQTVGTYMMYILACLVIVTFMFFMLIIIVTLASNIPIMMN